MIYYVATTGNNNGGRGTLARPWLTIEYGINQLLPGDTLIVQPGVYLGKANCINSALSGIPNGIAGAPTRIIAESPLNTVIRNNEVLTTPDSLLRLQGNYVEVDGFVFDLIDSPSPEYNVSIEGNFNKVKRCIARRQGDVNAFGGWVSILGSNNLVEDVYGVGAARYGFYTGGPDSTANQNIFRRAVGRVDYSNSDQPKSTFAVYGNNEGHNVHSVLLQNCIAIDSRRGPSTGEDTYGGMYFPKNAAGVTIQGSLVLNCEVGHAGIFYKEQQGRDITLEHTAVWGTYSSSDPVGIRAGGGTLGEINVDYMTIGDNPFAYVNQDSSSVRSLKNSLFYENGALALYGDYGWTESDNNAFVPAGQATGNNPITTGIVAPQNILRQDAGYGANITQEYGESGTLWGEAGYNTRTTNDLWPWKNEDKIKEWFSVPNDPPAGNVPSVNNTVRGFTVANDQFGNTQTLTRYIWQYLGKEMPLDISGTAPAAEALPPPPPPPPEPGERLTYPHVHYDQDYLTVTVAVKHKDGRTIGTPYVSATTDIADRDAKVSAEIERLKANGDIK